VDDDKGPTLIALEALASFLAVESALPVNVKLLIEGEEETGSPSLPPILSRYRELLAADAILSADGARWRPDLVSVNVSSRGNGGFEFCVRTAKKDLHSGRYGGVLPNALHVLVGYCQVVHRPCSGYQRGMNIPTHVPRLKGYRYPREIIAYAVWAYHRLALSTADVEDLLAARGVIVSREAIRLWVNRFGRHFADCIRRDRPRPNDKWHIDEVVITIRGKKHWLWRAIDANGDVLDILVQSRRNAKAANRLFQRLVSQLANRGS